MSALLAAAVALARTTMKQWADDASATLSAQWRPIGSAGASVDGPDPLRILLIGSGVAAEHVGSAPDRSLAGGIARGLNARTGRGVTVDAIVDPTMTIACLEPILGRTPLSSYDGVVTCLGDVDAVRAVRPEEWRRRVASTIALWCRTVRDRRVMIVVGVGDPGATQTIGSVHGWLSDSLARQLNAITDELTAGVPSVHTTLLPRLADTNRRGGIDPHDLWGRQLAAELVDHWRAIGRPGFEFAAAPEPWQRFVAAAG